MVKVATTPEYGVDDDLIVLDNEGDCRLPAETHDAESWEEVVSPYSPFGRCREPVDDVQQTPEHEIGPCLT